MSQALDEYAIRFFLLVQQAFKTMAREQIDAVYAASFHAMEKEGQERYMRTLKGAAGIDDYDPEDYSGIEALKEALHG